MHDDGPFTFLNRKELYYGAAFCVYIAVLLLSNGFGFFSGNGFSINTHTEERYLHKISFSLNRFYGYFIVMGFSLFFHVFISLRTLCFIIIFHYSYCLFIEI